MNAELTNRLFDKYPKIFEGKDKGIRESLIAFGCEHGDGWYWLIDNLCESLQATTDNRTPPHPQVVATQVKEKFGSLRFYVGGATDGQYGMIEVAENMSYHICEVCGSTDDVTQSSGGWVFTRRKGCRR